MALLFIHYLLLWFWVCLVLTVKFSLTICSNVIVHSNHRKQIYFLTADLEISYCIVQSCCLQQCPSLGVALPISILIYSVLRSSLLLITFIFPVDSPFPLWRYFFFLRFLAIYISTPLTLTVHRAWSHWFEARTFGSTLLIRHITARCDVF